MVDGEIMTWGERSAKQPTIAGFYWFRGVGEMSTDCGPENFDEVVEVVRPADLEPSVAFCGVEVHFPLAKCKGRWWGPIPRPRGR